MKYELGGVAPTLGKNVFVAPNAAVMGKTTLGDNVSVWFGAVLRADTDTITVGDNTNIQDNAVIHVDPGFPTIIGAGVTVGHKVMLHGCTVGDGALIGMNAVVLNGAVIGQCALIGANALVTENMQIPDGALVLGSPAKVVKILDAEAQKNLGEGAKGYVQKIPLFNDTLRAIND